MKKYIAECIGTAVLTLLGCGTAVFVGCGTPAAVVWNGLAGECHCKCCRKAE